MLDAITSPVEHPIDQERFATNVSQRSHLPQQLQIRSCGCIYRRLSSVEASTRITAEIGCPTGGGCVRGISGEEADGGHGCGDRHRQEQAGAKSNAGLGVSRVVPHAS